MPGSHGVDDAQLAEAVVVWTGWHRFSWPHPDDDAVVRHFGDEQASALLPLIHELRDDFYSSDAKWTAPDLVEMGERASSEFRAKHPSLPEEAVEALEWCYTFDYR